MLYRCLFDQSMSHFPPYLQRQPPSESLGPVCERLKTFYAACNKATPGAVRVVCNFSCNYFKLEDALYLGDWLKENSIRLWALDLSSNCIDCSSATDLQHLVTILEPQVDWLQLGGNQLPSYTTSSSELSDIQSGGRVSLALLLDDFGAPSLTAESTWRHIAVHFDRNAYGYRKGYVTASV